MATLMKKIYELLNISVKGTCVIANLVVFISLFLLVADLGIGVIMRYTIEYVPAWYEELAKIFLVWLTFAGGIVAADRNEHVSINIFSEKTPPLIKKFLAILVQILILFTATLIVFYGYKFAKGGLRGVFPTIDFLPLYAAYIAVPIGYAGILLVSLRNIIKQIIF